MSTDNETDDVTQAGPVSSFLVLGKSLLRGSGQVMFQNHAGCGAFFLAGIAVGSPPAVTVAALLGLVVSTLATPKEDRQDGLGGYNGILIGAALGTFLAPQPLLVLLGCLVVPSVTRAIPRPLTAPFVLVTWLLLLSAHQLTGLAAAAPVSVQEFSLGFWVTSVLQGISQVFLVQNPVTGVLFLLGLALSSRWAAGLTLFGSISGAALALAAGASRQAVEAGLFGFSPVLTAIALGCTFFSPTPKNLARAATATVFTVFVQAAFNAALQPVALPALTAPFVLVTWIFLLGTHDRESSRGT